MSRKRYTPEQITGRLREAEVSLSQGMKTTEVCRRLGVSEQGSDRALARAFQPSAPAFGSELLTTGAGGRLDQPRSGRLPSRPAIPTGLAETPDPPIKGGRLKSGWSA